MSNNMKPDMDIIPFSEQRGWLPDDPDELVAQVGEIYFVSSDVFEGDAEVLSMNGNNLSIRDEWSRKFYTVKKRDLKRIAQKGNRERSNNEGV